jgi:hypothetical protein
MPSVRLIVPGEFRNRASHEASNRPTVIAVTTCAVKRCFNGGESEPAVASMRMIWAWGPQGMRFVLSALASVLAFAPGFLLGFEISQWAAPLMCPKPDEPNFCALLSSFAIMGISAFATSMVVGGLVWRAIPAKAGK